ncbi:MAG: response regulator, partial [Deltaproteobacteria bacterium]|nr:response regulator [Deltaproteobacteria bacterium]
MGNLLKVLIVEDSSDDKELMLRELRRANYVLEYERVETPDGMKKALDERAWDIVLSDYSLPCFSAPAALTILKENGIDIPFIIISGAIGEETAVESMRAGAHDFVIKGKLTRLVSVIERELREAVVRREHREVEEALRVKSMELDSLNKDLHDLTMEITRVEDAERKRFAEVLHDDIGQKLVAIEMGLSVFIRGLGESSDEAV